MVPVLGGIVLFLAVICSIPKKNYLFLLLLLFLIYPFFDNYIEEFSKTNDMETKNMIQYIEENSSDQKLFLHIGEFSLGEMEYYFPDSEHYYYENIPIYVTVPEIFGNVHKLSVEEELPKQQYILISKISYEYFVEEYDLQILDSSFFDIPYQGERYVYVLQKN